MHEELLQMIVGQITVWLLERLKGPTQNNEAAQLFMKRMCRAISWDVAALTTMGLSFEIDGSLATGGTVGIHFPSLYGFLSTVGHLGGQILFQEYRYKALKEDRRQSRLLELLEARGTVK